MSPPSGCAVTYYLGSHSHDIDVPPGTIVSDLLHALVDRHGDLGPIARFEVNYQPVTDMARVIVPVRGGRSHDVRIKSRSLTDALGDDSHALGCAPPDPSPSSPLRPLIVVTLPDIVGSTPGEGPLGIFSPRPTVVPTVDAVEVMYHEPGFGYLIKLIKQRRRCTWGFGPTTPQSFFFLDTRTGHVLPLECHQSERVVSALVNYGAILGQFVMRYKTPRLGRWNMAWSPVVLPPLSGDNAGDCIVCAARPPEGWWSCGALHGNTCALCAVRVRGCPLCRDAEARYLPADRVLVDVEKPTAAGTEAAPTEPVSVNADAALL